MDSYNTHIEIIHEKRWRKKEMESNSTFLPCYHSLEKMVFDLYKIKPRNKRERKFIKLLKKKMYIVFDWNGMALWILKDLKADKKSAKIGLRVESFLELVNIDPETTVNIILMLEINGITVEITNASPTFEDREEINRTIARDHEIARKFRIIAEEDKNNRIATTT